MLLGPLRSLAVPGLPSPQAAVSTVWPLVAPREAAPSLSLPSSVHSQTRVPSTRRPGSGPPGPACARHTTLLKSLSPHSCPASEAPPARSERAWPSGTRGTQITSFRGRAGLEGPSDTRLPCGQAAPTSASSSQPSCRMGSVDPCHRSGQGQDGPVPAHGCPRDAPPWAVIPPFVVQRVPLAVWPLEDGVRCRVVPGLLPPLARPCPRRGTS